MTISREAGNHILEAQEPVPKHITGDGRRPHVISAARRGSLPARPIPDVVPEYDGDVRPRPAQVSTQKPTVEFSAKRLKSPDRKAARSCAWFSGDGWAMEIIAAACSICCFVAIVAVLMVYDGQRSPSLPFGITLNAIISILSTTAKSSIMFGITAAMGQAKWDRFNTQGTYHRLLDLEYIDQASRGPLGSFRILFTAAGRSVSSVGAIVTLLMLAVDPFVQQLLTYQQEPTPVSSDLAWTEQVLAPTIFSNHSDPVYFGMFNSALWNPEASYERKAHCPTLNCTYPSFQSMGLCAVTRQVPLDQIFFAGKACEMTFSDTTTGEVIFGDFNALITSYNSTKPSDACRVSFWGANETFLPIRITTAASGGTEHDWNFPLDVTSPMEIDLDGQNDILGVRSPLLALGRISWSSPSLVGDGSMSLRFEKAEQVVIAFCAGVYQTTVRQGNTSTSVADLSSPRGFSYFDSTTMLGPNATCWTSGSEKTTFPGAEIKQSVNGRYIAKVSPLSFCTDNWGWGVDIASRLTCSAFVGMDLNGSVHPPAVSSTVHPRFLTGSSRTTNQDALHQIQARSLSDVSRSITESLNALFRKYSSDRIVGFYMEYDTVVRVQWPWLTLPVAVEVLGIMFLAWIVLRNPKSPSPWKGSILATLFHGLSPSGQVTDNLNTISSMEQEALKTLVKLETSDSGPTFLHDRNHDTA